MLDFNVYGVPRSGTSALAHVLNLHPQVYCGHERFAPTVDPHLVRFPASFISHDLPGSAVGREHAQERMRVPNEIKVVGDKQPRKFYFPQHLLDVPRNVVIYRPYEQTIPSWNKRAENPDDATWSRSTTGVFFFLDLYFMLLTVPQTEDALVLDYANLYYGDWQRETTAMFEYLNVDPNELDEPGFLNQFYSLDAVRSKERSLSEREQQLAESFGLDAFEQEFAGSDPRARPAMLRRLADNVSVGLLGELEASLTPSEFSWLDSVGALVAKGYENRERLPVIDHAPNQDLPGLAWFLRAVHAQGRGDLERYEQALRHAIEANPAAPSYRARLAT